MGWEWVGVHSETTEEEHMEPESPSRIDGNWLNDTRLRKVNVVVCIPGCTIAATTYRMYQQRLLDALRGGFVANSYRLGRDFLPLTEVEAFFWNGEKEHLASSNINKSSILFVAEISGGQPDRTSIKEVEAYPRRAKKALSTKIHISPYTIVGKMHAELWQKLLHVIEGEEGFLPMTDAIISPPLLAGEWTFSFVAINKHQIVRIDEIDESSEVFQVPTPVVVRKVRRRKQKAAAVA
jgi:hypothetical protein